MKISDKGRVFLVPTRTAFVPGAFSVPGSAWDRTGRAALPLHERPPAGRACHSGRARAGTETVWAQGTKTGSPAILSLSEFSSPQAPPGYAVWPRLCRTGGLPSQAELGNEVGNFTACRSRSVRYAHENSGVQGRRAHSARYPECTNLRHLGLDDTTSPTVGDIVAVGSAQCA